MMEMVMTIAFVFLMFVVFGWVAWFGFLRWRRIAQIKTEALRYVWSAGELLSLLRVVVGELRGLLLGADELFSSFKEEAPSSAWNPYNNAIPEIRSFVRRCESPDDSTGLLRVFTRRLFQARDKKLSWVGRCNIAVSVHSSVVDLLDEARAHRSTFYRLSAAVEKNKRHKKEARYLISFASALRDEAIRLGVVCGAAVALEREIELFNEALASGVVPDWENVCARLSPLATELQRAIAEICSRRPASYDDLLGQTRIAVSRAAVAAYHIGDGKKREEVSERARILAARLERLVANSKDSIWERDRLLWELLSDARTLVGSIPDTNREEEVFCVVVPFSRRRASTCS